MIEKWTILLVFIALNSGCISTPGGGKVVEGNEEGYISPSGILYDYTPEKFEEALNSGKPTLLEFSVDWCWECAKLAPIMRELRAEYDEKANIITANADVEIDLQGRYKIHNIPSFVVFDRNGKVKAVLIGFQRKENLEQVLDELI